MKVKLNTILSSFDDKATLLKWLKKVEKALAENVLEEITAEAVTATTSKLVFHFADESTIETPAFTVKGDKGDTGATGPRGLIALYYTKLYDDVLTKQSTINLPEGNFNRQPQGAEQFVLFTGTTATAQFALLTVSTLQEVTGYITCYVDDVIAVKGPKGDRGPQGPQGPHGDPIDAYGLASLVTGSETIVVDLNPQETAVEFHLDADVIEKIENSLQLYKHHVVVTRNRSGYQSDSYEADIYMFTNTQLTINDFGNIIKRLSFTNILSGFIHYDSDYYGEHVTFAVGWDTKEKDFAGHWEDFEYDTQTITDTVTTL